jgi:hypothetical protein
MQTQSWKLPVYKNLALVVQKAGQQLFFNVLDYIKFTVQPK